jgi:hypothetical protein
MATTLGSSFCAQVRLALIDMYDSPEPPVAKDC